MRCWELDITSACMRFGENEEVASKEEKQRQEKAENESRRLEAQQAQKQLKHQQS